MTALGRLRSWEGLLLVLLVADRRHERHCARPTISASTTS